MPLSRNDMVLVDYTVTVKESGEVIETTSVERAREFKIYDPSRVYEPLLVIIGEGRVVRGFEEALERSEVGIESEVEVPPDKAYGVRDPSKVKVIPLKAFLKSGVRPEVGKVVEVDGQLGIVRNVSSGRVIVDFNHPLADKTLKYRFKVLRKLESDEEKIKYIVKRYIKDVDLNELKVSIDSGLKSVIIELPRNTYMQDGIQVAKRLIASDLLKYLNFSEVSYVERYVREGPTR